MNSKKIIIVLICVICLCGCWKSKIQVSEFHYQDNYVVGTIKNLTKEKLDIRIEFEYKSGSLKESGFCYEEIEPEETKRIECLEYDIDDSYSIKVKEIVFE